MPDILIRNFPAEDLSLLDEQAARLGISRSEYLRRHLHREARRTVGPVTAADLRALGSLVADLADDTVMSASWLIDKSALVRLCSSVGAEVWADRIERGLVAITTVTLLEARVPPPGEADVAFDHLEIEELGHRGQGAVRHGAPG